MDESFNQLNARNHWALDYPSGTNIQLKRVPTSIRSFKGWFHVAMVAGTQSDGNQYL